jgi:M6 family metalloprotease-like protein
MRNTRTAYFGASRAKVFDSQDFNLKLSKRVMPAGNEGIRGLRVKQAYLAISVALLSSLILTACGGGGESVREKPNTSNSDTTAPTLTQVTAVTTPNNDNTPSYTFSSSEAGMISYGGSCASVMTSATSGNNTVTFSSLAYGTYNTCTIRVTDAAGNASNLLSISAFVINSPNTTAPTLVTTKEMSVLSNALIIPPGSALEIPKAPDNVAAIPQGKNLKLWIYDPRNNAAVLNSQIVFLGTSGGIFSPYPVASDGTLSFQLSAAGQYGFDVVEPPGTSNTFERARYLVDVPSAGPVPLRPPQIPASINHTPAGSNVKLWVYDPLNPERALATVIFLLSTNGGNWSDRIPVMTDGSLAMKLDAGQYLIDVAEPNSNFIRRRYELTVAPSGEVSIPGLKANSQGVFPLTVSVPDLPGTPIIKGLSPNAKGVYAVTVRTLPIQSALGQTRRANLIASADENAASFVATSACQLLDQVTPIRTIDGLGLTAGFPKVGWRLPSFGRIRSLIVPVDFPDVNGADHPPTFFTPLASSVRDFYSHQSYGQVAFDFEIFPNWVRMPFSVSDFGYGSTVGSGSPGEYLKAMLEKADPVFDFAQYDAVYFLVPQQMPFTKMGWGPAITHPYWTKNGYITNGATGGADMYFAEKDGIIGAQWKWMVHETGHAFGLYDEDQDHQSQTLGSWSVMANSWTNKAIELNGWDRYLQGWLKDSQTTCLERSKLTALGTSIKLNPLVRQNTEMKLAMVPLSSSKILVLESRKNEAFDRIPTQEEGVLVYTVDMKLGHLKGGYKTQRRIGSSHSYFEDAALRAGDSLSIDGIIVTVVELNASGDTIRIGIK